MPETDLPRGLVLFAPGTPAPVRRRRLLLVAVVACAAVALVWPVYPLFGSAFPLVLGLPLSLAWVVLWLVVTFVALAWVYRHDVRGAGPERAETTEEDA